MGKKTPLYSGGNKPTVIPLTSPAQSGTTAREGQYYRSGRYYRLDPAVLPRYPGPCYQGGTTAREGRYYRLERYYRPYYLP